MWDGIWFVTKVGEEIYPVSFLIVYDFEAVLEKAGISKNCNIFFLRQQLLATVDINSNGSLIESSNGNNW